MYQDACKWGTYKQCWWVHSCPIPAHMHWKSFSVLKVDWLCAGALSSQWCTYIYFPQRCCKCAQASSMLQVHASSWRKLGCCDAGGSGCDQCSSQTHACWQTALLKVNSVYHCSGSNGYKLWYLGNEVEPYIMIDISCLSHTVVDSNLIWKWSGILVRLAV